MAEDKTSKAASASEGDSAKVKIKMEHPNADEKLSAFGKRSKIPKWALIVIEILIFVLGALTLVVCLAEIIVTIVAAVTNKIYDAEQSGHMVTMVVLAVTAAVTLSIVIYSFVGLCKKHTRPLHTTAAVLFIIALIQSLLTGLVVHVRESDHVLINKALTDSFILSLEGNSRHIGLWSSTQFELECCGLDGPDDYRRQAPPIFPPNVPISCCTSYDYTKPDSSQERDRELCRAQRGFYETGCRKPVIDLFVASSHAVVVCTSFLIVLEIIVGIGSALSGTLRKKLKKFSLEDKKDATPQNS